MPETKATRELNRRTGRRRPPRTTVRVECRKGTMGLGPNICDTFLDLSEGGVRVIIKTEVPAKSEVEVLLTGFGVHRPIKMIGSVCWVVPLEDGRFCIGVSFQKRLAYRDVQALCLP